MILFSYGMLCLKRELVNLNKYLNGYNNNNNNKKVIRVIVSCMGYLRSNNIYSLYGNI